jgi:hypothetical protein
MEFNRCSLDPASRGQPHRDILARWIVRKIGPVLKLRDPPVPIFVHHRQLWALSAHARARQATDLARCGAIRTRDRKELERTDQLRQLRGAPREFLRDVLANLDCTHRVPGRMFQTVQFIQ